MAARIGRTGQTLGDWNSESRIYVGPLAPGTQGSEIEAVFKKFGPIYAIDMKKGFCFVQFDERRDAEDACREMDGRNLPDSIAKLTVTLSKRGDRKKLDKCYHCGLGGHISADCPTMGGSRSRRERDSDRRHRSPPRDRHYSSRHRRGRSRSRSRSRNGRRREDSRREVRRGRSYSPARGSHRRHDRHDRHDRHEHRRSGRSRSPRPSTRKNGRRRDDENPKASSVESEKAKPSSLESATKSDSSEKKRILNEEQKDDNSDGVVKE